MDDKWAFLRPWRQMLQECKTLHDSLDSSNSRDFRASNLPVHASVRCWPSLPKGYQALGGRCSIPIPFPANAAIRRDRVKVQGIREAVEIFNVLATVSRAAFLELVAEFVVVADNFDDLFTPDYIFVFPVWECYLVGTLGSEDIVANEAAVTWGTLFGCPDDPMEYSTEFRGAMDALEIMRKQVTGALCDFMGRRAKAEWGDASSVIEWTAEHAAIPTKGAQVHEENKCESDLSTVDSFSHQLRKLFEIKVPSVVQLCAVGDSAKMLRTWEQTPPNLAPQTVEALKPMFSASGSAELTNALAYMNLKTFRLYLDEAMDLMQPGEALTDAGFMLSTLVYGQSTCKPTGDKRSPIHRNGGIGDLQVTFAGHSTCRPAGICSAIAESSSVEELTLRMGTIGDRNPSLNHNRWGWLAYALWSSASNSSIQSAKITNIHLARSTIGSVAAALARNFPPTQRLQYQQPVYGYIDIQEGTELRPIGVETVDTTMLVMSRSCRCRARCDESDANGEAEVVVPGYGLCQLKPGDEANKFVPDEPVISRFQGGQSSGLRSLSLEFFEIENHTLVPNLLESIGKNLRSLSLGMFWTGRRRHIMLDDVAAACPHLEELCLANFEVIISSTEELHNWGVRKLSIQSTEEVVGLTDCLSDPTHRISRELAELEMTFPRSMRDATRYADALTSRNGDYLAVTKEKLPLKSKAGIISVVEGKHTNQAEAVHRLNEIIMGFIIAFAATPKRRSVRVSFS
ncbi:hypothetical protein PRIC2_002619 [Phytophthora ramorum]